MNNDRVEVDELIRQIADYKNDLRRYGCRKTFEEVLDQLGGVPDICGTACTKPGYLTAPVSNYDKLSKEYNSGYISVVRIRFRI